MEEMAVLEVMEVEVEMAGTRLQDITEVMVVKVDMDNPRSNITGWN